MTSLRVKQVLATAAALPPARGRALIAAVAAKAAAKKPDPETYLDEAAGSLAAAMEQAVLAELERSLEP